MKLYEILKERNILTENETDFLQTIHNQVHFSHDGKKYYIKDGVHQGSPISPALFNIYIEEVINCIRNEFGGNELWYKLFADDVVFILTASKLKLFIKILLTHTREYNL